MLDNLIVNLPLSDLEFWIYYIRTIIFLLYSFFVSFKILDFKKLNLSLYVKVLILTHVIFVFHFILKSWNQSFPRIIFLVFAFCISLNIITEKSFLTSIVSSLVSLSINYIFLFTAIFVNFIINVIHLVNSDYINLAIIISVYSTILFTICKIRRFKYGLPFLTKFKENEFIDILILNISLVILFIYITIINFNAIKSNYILLYFIALSIIMFITIKKSITLYYKHNLLVKELNDTKSELDSKKKELSELEKENLEFIKTSHSIAHKQKALEYKISKLSMNSEIASEIDINDDLAKIGNEYSKATNPTTFSLAKTGINEIDDMLDFLQNQCINNKIDFDLKLNGNIHYMTNHFISIEDLQILLADHIKDAMIAIKYSDNVNRSILVRLGLVDDVYSLYIYDSGIEFEIDTLLNLGTNPITTHSDDGGTGLGFMNTFDTLNKYSASLCINEISIPCIDNYTKAIIIKFDKLHKLEIKSYRSEAFRGKIFQNNFDII